VADYDAVAGLASEVEAEVGPVSVLVNNAGVFQMGDFLDHGIDDWRWIRSINLDGVVHGCFAFGPSHGATPPRPGGQHRLRGGVRAHRAMNFYSTTRPPC